MTKKENEKRKRKIGTEEGDIQMSQLYDRSECSSPIMYILNLNLMPPLRENNWNDWGKLGNWEHFILKHNDC